MTVLDYEHQALARLIDNVARTAHEPDDCSLCADLDVRRHLHGLAGQIRAAAERRVNNTPHEHGPKPADPEPSAPPAQDDPPPAQPPSDRGGS